MAHANLVAVSGIAQIADAAFPGLVALLKADQVKANVTTAVSYLQNAIGALVAYAEKPNVTKLDKFQTLLSTGVSEWNNALAAINRTSEPTPVRQRTDSHGIVVERVRRQCCQRRSARLLRKTPVVARSGSAEGV